MIDSHCHLAGEEFAPDLPEVIARARAAGVTGALVILSAGEQAEASQAVRVRQLWPAAEFAVGIHPHRAGSHAGDPERAMAMVGKALTAHEAIALGEIGLDYHYAFAPRDVQQGIFRQQIDLARERGLPIAVHTREATEHTFDLLREHASGITTVFHCFSGGAEMAAAALELGAWLSFAGIVTFPKALDLQEVARTVPPDRFLVETDSPYLAPVPFRGKRNEPAYLTEVIEAIAHLRGETAERVAVQTTENFHALFGR